MKRLGISVYPNHTDINEIVKYIHLAGKYGFKRIFTCLISVADKNLDDVLGDFKLMLNTAKEEDMEVIADLEPAVFKFLGASIYDLKAFKDMGLDGIRLDLGFSGMEESIMSFNEYGLKIELNMSNGTKYVDNILSYNSNVNNLYGCHNFYPHKYTGLSLEHFMKCSKQFKELGINTAAFVNSKSAKYGPWPVSEGICTLESHRDLNIEVQAKHFLATGLIDDVIIANSFASEEELKALSDLNKEKLVFNVQFNEYATELDKKIVLEEYHYNRGDVSEYILRSTQSRVKYKGESFPAVNTPDIKRGDILIDSDLYTRYAGELQVALKDMKNTGKTNVVGKIVDEEIFLLDYIKPWTSFGFKK
ncbi:MupG family TIM beta-alpha barrel fold protein [Clostridium sp. CTA-5]